jgi:hypothetical protein
MTRPEFLATTLGALAAAALGRPVQAQRGVATDASLGATGESAAWTRFRGPNGTGVVPGGGYPNIGPSTLAWKRPLPMGKSSPVLTNTHIFLTVHGTHAADTELFQDVVAGRELLAALKRPDGNRRRHVPHRRGGNRQACRVGCIGSGSGFSA